MKGLVILLGVCCFITLLAAGEGRQCGTRNQKRYWESVRAEISCMKPKLQLVQLPVPDGYDYVTPRVAMLHQCTGHRCPVTREQCVAVMPEDIELAVTAYKKNDILGTCYNITMQEHHTCECECSIQPSDCSKSQMYDVHMCKCVCRPELKEECYKRMEDGDSVMWDAANCNCRCDVQIECSSNEYWIPDVCGCRAMMPSSSEDNNLVSANSEENYVDT